MYVLIVDDDATSRKLVKYVLSKFENIVTYEATNGKRAVSACKEHEFDLIFMDIGMPEMNGIEASRLIKEHDKNVLIVGLSADGESDTARQLLKNGAIDYITKPINAEILRQRVSNYLHIIESHQTSINSTKPINTFKANVFAYFLTFKIAKEGHLGQFWEYYMNEYNTRLIPHIDEIVNAFFNIAVNLLHRGGRCVIFVEQNENDIYFTLKGTSDINKNVLGEMILKEIKEQNENIGFLATANKVTIKAKKSESEIKLKDSVAIAPIKKQEPVQAAEKPIQASYEPAKPQEVKLTVYSFIEQDDLLELVDYLSDLESTLAVLQYSALSPSEVAIVADIMGKVASLLSGYNETFDISISLKSLGYDIRENTQAFIDKSRALSSLFITFSQDLKHWQNALFVSGAPSENFMDATIVANASTIANLIKPQTASADDMDDIFGF